MLGDSLKQNCQVCSRLSSYAYTKYVYIYIYIYKYQLKSDMVIQKKLIPNFNNYKFKVF